MSETAGPELLLGLLAEPEWRAATILSAVGIDAAQVVARWRRATLGVSRERPLAPELHAALRQVAAWNRRHGLPAALATEHLLLALLECDDDTADWLVDHGLSKNELRGQILRLYDALSDELGPPIEMPNEAPPRDESVAAEAPQESMAAGRGGALPEGEPREGATAPPVISERSSLLRILDAAANRASEGLRVVEDYVRFALDDRFLLRQTKELRHELASVLSALPRGARMAARDTQADVGTTVTTAAELARPNLLAVAIASSERVAQALRSLEEYAKVLDPRQAAQLAALRYRHYTLQRAWHLAGESRSRLAGVRLYVLVDGGADEADFVRRVQALIAAGVDVLQLRDKRLGDRALLARGRTLRELTAGTRTLFIVNDRPDLAVLCAADGVHVGQDELPVKEVRAMVGPDALIGVSTHSLDQARRAVLDGASYLGVGPTFASGTKQFAQFPGLDLVAQVAGEIALPWFAIGGIGPQNVTRVLEAGARRVAVCGSVWAAEEPRAAVAALQAALASVPDR